MSPLFRARMALVILGASLSLSAIAAPDEEAPKRPRWLFKSAVLQAQNSSGTTAVIDKRDRLWITSWPGSNWMLPHSKLNSTPDGIEFGDMLCLWSTKRSGLWIKNYVEIRTETGRLMQTETVEAPLLDIISHDDQVALLMPGELRLLTPRKSESKVIPLPFIHPRSAEILDGNWVIRDVRNRSLDIDPKTGCPGEFDPGVRALERWMAHKTESVCGDPPALPRNVRTEAELQRVAAIEAAALASDQLTLAAMGVRTRPQLKRIRPEKTETPGSFRTRDEGLADVPEELLGGGFTVFVKNPQATMPLKNWVIGKHAPACHARILLMPEDDRTALALQMRLRALRKERNNCAHSLYLTENNAVDINYDFAWYVDDESHRVGRRTGMPTARLVRLDLARLKQDDFMRRLAEAPELYAEWTEGPGPSFELSLDIDGSWIGDSGWDLLAGSPSHDRVNRVELAGPVRDITVLSDGLIEAKTGGQPVRIEFRWATGTVEWLDSWPGSTGVDTDKVSARLSRATGAVGEVWKVSNGQVYRPFTDEEFKKPESEKLTEDEVEPPNQLEGSGEGHSPQASADGPRMVDGNIVLNLPIKAIRVVPIEGGAIVQTSFGLVGIDTGGSVRWRLTEVNDFVISRRWLIVATPWGIRGHRIPPPVSTGSPGGSK